MTRSLVVASAGAGKSRLIVKQSLERVALGEKVLILTYTKNNQEELVKKFCKLGGIVPTAVTIKGWFTFLLEDMIRPYQSCLFLDRIPNINFNSVDPHKRNGRNIPGSGEMNGANYNPDMVDTCQEQRRIHCPFCKVVDNADDSNGVKLSSSSALSETGSSYNDG